ncbi:SWI/SNF-related matrix-associated actin-dependent regulator of chromatin subfamily A-like protein 1 [Enteropsectra breve]|nr:SWI/SNF-related matrix-associated actin-dependent regulator of chromatin subfamily A-like protein 1 [Enteropsectra breve]
MKEGPQQPYQQLFKKHMEKNKIDPNIKVNTEKTIENHKNIVVKNDAPKPGVVKSVVQRVKFSLISPQKILAKPSNKVISSLLSGLEGSVYDLKANEWTFKEEHYEKLAHELSKTKIEYEKIPAGTLRLLRRPQHQLEFTLEGDIYDRLMDFQREGVLFGLSRNGRLLLADDMGLGKTIQALAIAYFYRIEFPLLIIAPASLLGNWSDSIKRFLNEEATVVQEKADLGNKITIVSYNLASSLIEYLKYHSYGVIICDECHYLKSLTSKRTKGLLPILQKASRLIMVSGTPATSRPLELYPIISALDKTAFPTFGEYGMRYCNGRKIGHFWDYRGCTNAQELSIALERSFMIRRVKDSVLGQLPKKFRKHIILDTCSVNYRDLEKRVYALGEQAESTLLTDFQNAVGLKKAAVVKYVDQILGKNIKTVVFAHHQEMLNELEDFVKQKGIGYIRIDGATPGAKRNIAVENFQKVDGIKIAILSITACSTGLTLTEGKAVIFAELYWNPGTLLQAEDRIHRIGQKDNVDIHYLVAKGTVDEIVWPHIIKKLNVLESLNIGKNDLKNVKKDNNDKKEQKRMDAYIS